MEQAEQAYVDQLVEYIFAHGTCRLTQIGNNVRRPTGVRRTLKIILQRQTEFVLHDPQQGGGGETVSLAPNVAAKMELEQYFQRLLDQIIAVGGDIFLSTLGGLVPKPAGERRQLKAIIESRPDLFMLERGAAAGGGHAWIVRAAAGDEPDPDPDLATLDQVARAF